MKEYVILIIDDNIEIIQIIIDLLEDEYPNYVFFSAINGEQGIRIAESRKPDLIIVDWDMPGISGIEVIRYLRRKHITNRIPIVMLTGVMIDSVNLKMALDAGANDYLRKPIDEIELVARVKSMLSLADSYKNIIQLKDRQLTFAALDISRKNRLNMQVILELEEARDNFADKNVKLKNKLNAIIRGLSDEAREDSWNSFKTYFINVYPMFFKRLIQLSPDISPAEMRLAAFLRLNLSSKEIASLVFIAPESVKTARNRLRKKLNLSPEENLNTFLMAL